MNIEDKLPKAEDVLLKHVFISSDGTHEYVNKIMAVNVRNAMHEYARRLLDVAASECDSRIISGHSVQAPSMLEAGKAILKLKEMLK